MSTLALAQAGAKTYKPSELPGFRLAGFAGVKYEDSPKPENVLRTFAVQFFNGTPEEVESVDVLFWVEVDGKTVYQKPITLKRFYTFAFANWGTALPGQMAYGETFKIDYPSEDWNSKSIDHLRVVAIRARNETGDLHDIGHLYTWLGKTDPPAVLAKLKDDPSILRVHNESGVTAIMVAIAGGRMPVIEGMISLGAEFRPVNRVANSDNPAILLAAINDHVEVLEWIVKKQGIAIDAVDTGKQTALDIALQSGHIANAKWLLANGANPNRLDIAGNPPLFYALPLKDISILDVLVKAGADLRYHTDKGYGPMHMAASRGYDSVKQVEKFYQLGISVNDADPRFGMTPLMVAAAGHCYDVALWLLGHGADLDAKDKNGKGVLDYARFSNTLHTDRFFRERVLDKLPKSKGQSSTSG